MNKVYFAAPVLAMLIFAGVFFATQRGSAEREAAHARAVKLERENKLKAEMEARQKAIADAVTAQEIRKKERAEKDARELAEQEARQKIIEQRDKTFREQDRLAKQIERLKKDIEVEQTESVKIQEEMKMLEAERTFLADFVKRTAQNAKALETLLTQIAAAESARVAEAAAKKSS